MGLVLVDSLLGPQAPVLGLGELTTEAFFLLSKQLRNRHGDRVKIMYLFVAGKGRGRSGLDRLPKGRFHITSSRVYIMGPT